MAVTRWREDTTRDNWGSFIYLRDLRSGKIWSAGYQPVGGRSRPLRSRILRGPRHHHAHGRRADDVIGGSRLARGQFRSAQRISITNRGTRLREIEVTSYMELALADPRTTTPIRRSPSCSSKRNICTKLARCWRRRRPRSPSDQPIWAAHLSVVDGESVGDVQYETDRGKFLSRNRTARSPAAIFSGWPLSNSAGAVLDPVFQSAPARPNSARPDRDHRILDNGSGESRGNPRSR